jgi:osmotically-inducible protein OsmY
MPVSILPVSHGCDVAKQAQQRLCASPYISFREIRCECRDGLLILRGRVESFHEKQQAQESVARLEGVAQIVNELEVTWSDYNS